MSNTVLRIENISKQYRLGQLGTGTLSHDLNRWWYKVRGKEDPYLKLGDTNDRSVAGGSDYVWSLKDINFDVKEGEVLGIIGKNGAGKSTLLKILSQVTTPTTGTVNVKGRIAALLEVGTGFHQDLTGRENVFLNGAILGMSKTEIKNKLDEIVEFSGIAKYIDTPVKRYSSGMLVRLGFAVAAHLDPEILIVDEVLAVGDAEFQTKCLGKMKDVSQQGRTVLFVSHNMGAVKNLCSKAMYLKNGRVEDSGGVDYILQKYYSDSHKANANNDLTTLTQRKGEGSILISSIELLSQSGVVTDTVNAGDRMGIKVKTLKMRDFNNKSFYAAIIINDGFGERMTTLSLDYLKIKINISQENEVTFWIDKCPLSTGKYSISALIWSEANLIDSVENVLMFNAVENDYYGNGVLQGANIDKFFIDYTCDIK